MTPAPAGTHATPYTPSAPHEAPFTPDPAPPAGGANPWPLLLAAAGILMVTMGIRQTTGLFLSPINTATGLGVATISLAMAIGQFTWGASQAVFGAVADRWGGARVIVLGGVLCSIGLALTPWMTSGLGLGIVMGVVTAAGAGAGSFSVLIGATASRIPAERRSMAAGFINAGGSFGQFVFAPLVERLIALLGWVNGLYVLAVSALITLPMAWKLRRAPSPRAAGPHAAGGPATGAAAVANAAGAAVTSATRAGTAAVSTAATGLASTRAAAPRPVPESGLRAQVVRAVRDRSYLLLNAGFFTCGFHIAFLVTHLPGEVALCNLPSTVSGISIALIGLANIVGSLAAGWAGGRWRMKHILFWMYLSRAVLVLLYLASPKEPLTFYLFAIGLGVTWLATVPPTAGLVGKLFGVRYMATLFGITMVSHQTGAFFGAWLGGILVVQTGDYQFMWWTDAALAAAAALLNLPIREARLPLRAVAA